MVVGLAFIAGWRMRPDARPLAPRVTADTVYINRDRPVPHLKWIDRIRWRTAPPTTVAVGPRGQLDTAAVRRYCTSVRDTSRGADTIAVLPDFRGRVSGSKVQFWSTLSDGRAYSALYKATSPHWSFLTDGDSLILRTERTPWGIGRALARCASGAGIGILGARIATNDLSATSLGLAAASGCGLRLVLP
jgi:hypothetical protein